MNNSTQLQPLRIFFQSFLWYFINWKTVLPISIITMIPGILSLIIFPLDNPDQSLPQFVDLLGSIWLIGSLTYFGGISMGGRHGPSVMESINHALYLYLPLFLLVILLIIASVIGLIFLVVPALWLGTVYFVAIPALIIERQGIYSALKSSFNLSAGYRWRLFRLYTYIMTFNVVLTTFLEFVIYKQSLLISLFTSKGWSESMESSTPSPTELHIELIEMITTNFICGIGVTISCIAYMQLTKRAHEL